MSCNNIIQPGGWSYKQMENSINECWK